MKQSLVTRKNRKLRKQLRAAVEALTAAGIGLFLGASAWPVALLVAAAVTGWWRWRQVDRVVRAQALSSCVS